MLSPTINNVEFDTEDEVMVTAAQLSEAVGADQTATWLQVVLESVEMVLSAGQLAITGGVLSVTCTLKVQVEEFPYWSVAV